MEKIKTSNMTIFLEESRKSIVIPTPSNGGEYYVEFYDRDRCLQRLIVTTGRNDAETVAERFVSKVDGDPGEASQLLME